MATKKPPKKTTTTVVEEEILDTPEPELPPETEPLPGPIDMRGDADPEDEDIRKFLSGMGDDECVVKIFKLDANAKLRFVGQTDIESASEV